MWLDEDTDAVLEWQREQALACGGCGQPRDESMDKQMSRPGAYKALPMRCHACAEKERAANDHHRKEGDMAGLYFAIEKRES